MWRSMKNLVFILEKRNKTLVEDIGHSGLRIRSDNILYLGDVLKMFDGNLTKLVFQYSDTPFATEDPPKIPNWILQLLSTNKKIIWARIEYSISDLIQILKFLPTYNLQYLSLELNEPYRISTNEDTEEVIFHFYYSDKYYFLINILNFLFILFHTGIPKCTETYIVENQKYASINITLV